MSPIRAVLLDFGGVLYRMPDLQRVVRWLKLFGIDDPGPLVMMNDSPTSSPLVMDIMTGKIGEQEVWDSIAHSWRVRPGILRFLRQRGFHRHSLDRELLAYFSGLRPRFRTAILTNAGTDFRATFSAVYQLERFTDQVIISAEEAIAKPDPALYEIAARRLEVAPAEAVFVDDRPENVDGAREAGMRAFVHRSTPETIRQLDEVLASE